MDQGEDEKKKIEEGRSKKGIGGYITASKVLPHHSPDLSDSESSGYIDDTNHIKTEGVESSLWKRRLANDPEMMKELHRYQRLMLLTLVPTISSEITASQSQSGHPHAYVHGNGIPSEDVTVVETKDIPQRRSSICMSDLINSNEMLPGLVHKYNPSPSELNRQKENNNKSRKISQLSSSSDSAISPVSTSNDNFKSIQKSRSSNNLSKDGKSVSFEQSQSQPEASGNSLDLMTLAALYLESRQRIFGDEWNQRQELRKESSQTIGHTGIGRPRRLSPLASPKSPRTFPNDNYQSDIDSVLHTGDVISAPRGLHLSVNYTNHLDLDAESLGLLTDRAEAMKPRLRRMNSLGEIDNVPLRENSSRSFHRPTSAPDLNKNANVPPNNNNNLLVPETPARANTPTAPSHSARLVRPQLIGGSLATNSAMNIDNRKSISPKGSLTTTPGPMEDHDWYRKISLAVPGKFPKTYNKHLPHVDLPSAPPPTADISNLKRSVVKLNPIADKLSKLTS